MNSQVTPQAAQQALRLLSRPDYFLPRYGAVLDQSTGREIQFDPEKITHHLQNTILSYFSDTPKDDQGFNKWLILLAGRQSGKSTTAALALYPVAGYNPGLDALTIADLKHRADYLHARTHFLHTRVPDEVRPDTSKSAERRQLTFANGSKIRTLSAESGNFGIGQSPDLLHVSEAPFWSDLSTAWSLLQPALINRKEARVIFETTPAPASAGSVETFRNIWQDAVSGQGRFLAAFFPYWDNLLCRREWKSTWVPTNEEVGLMNRYGPDGLEWENLAFRRIVMNTDPELRRYPELYDTFYPSDPVSCWISSSGGVIRKDLVERQLRRPLVPWRRPFKQYKPAREDAMYVIGVDPTGFGARDHAAIQVLEVWADRWEQVACYADNCGDPQLFAQEVLRLGRQYNNAFVVVESNGVGVGVLSLLRSEGYPNLYYEGQGRPGKTSTGKSVDEVLGYLIDSLLDNLVLNDEDTVNQLLSYKNDKRLEEQASTLMLRGGKIGRNRRERHHWDKVSALVMAVFGARKLPQREYPKPESGTNVIPLFTEMSYSRQREHQKVVAEDSQKSKKKRYSSVRRKRKK